MKKTLLLAVVVSLLTIFYVASPVQAREHIVKKGEYLSLIAKKYNVNSDIIFKANKQIKKRNLIYIGQKLEIPEKDAAIAKADQPIIWKVGGINPFGNRSFFKAMEKDLFDRLPKPVKSQFIEDVKKDRSYPYRMKIGQLLAQQIYDKYKVRNDVEVQLPEDQLDAELYSKVEFDGYVYFLIKPLICDNWSWWKEAAPKPPAPVLVAAPPKVEEPVVEKPKIIVVTPKKIVSVPEVTKVAEEPCTSGKCKTDLIAGFGFYRNVKSDQDADGLYGWLKIRERCRIGRVGYNDVYAGLALFLAGGDGHDRKYNYDWWQATIGPSFKIINIDKHFDADIDLMYGVLNNNGAEGSYKSDQEDTITIASAHLNQYGGRSKGRNWFPETEWNVEWRHILNAEHKHSSEGTALTPDPSDNEGYSFSINQAIYDIHAGDLRFTPSFKVEAGKEFGLAERGLASDGPINFVQAMPNIELAHKGDKILNVGAGYKKIIDGEGDQWQVAVKLDLTQKIEKIWNWLRK